MTITTYSGLKYAIADFLNRDDLTDTAIDSFIGLCEADLQRRLQDHYLAEVATTLTVNSQYTALPADFRGLIRLSVDGDNRSLNAITADEMQDFRYSNGDTAGKPRYYAITKGQLEVFPTPDEAYTVNLIYTQDLTPLSDSNTSNWVLAEAPDAYLYGSLAHTAAYLRDDGRLQTWITLYNATIGGMLRDSQDAVFGRSLKMRIGAPARIYSERY